MLSSLISKQLDIYFNLKNIRKNDRRNDKTSNTENKESRA